MNAIYYAWFLKDGCYLTLTEDSMIKLHGLGHMILTAIVESSIIMFNNGLFVIPAVRYHRY